MLPVFVPQADPTADDLPHRLIIQVAVSPLSPGELLDGAEEPERSCDLLRSAANPSANAHPHVLDAAGCSGPVAVGGQHVMERICLSPPDVTEVEEAALIRAFRSGWIAPIGPEVDAFEAELAEYCGRQYCVALSSGTAALHLGLVTLGVGPGDLVLTSSMTFAATANAIVYTGAEPVFVDSDETGNMNPDLLEVALAGLARAGRPVKAVVPVDMLGKVADHPRIDAIAADHGVPVLSDACESLGAVRSGRPAASYGQAAAVSFNGNKIVTTSGGGALFTDDSKFAGHVRYLATQARQPVVHYEHNDIGYNYRLSNLLAALGRAQLGRLESMIERRQEHRRFYSQLVGELPGVSIFGGPSSSDSGATSDNCWLNAVIVEPSVAGFDRTHLLAELAASSLEARPLWKPMHLQPVFAEHRAYVDGTSERQFTTGLLLPSGSRLTDAERDRVAAVVLEVAGR